MKKQLIITLLAVLPALATASPHRERGPAEPRAEQDHRRDMRMVLAEIKEQYPKKFNYLMKLREDDPMAFRKAMGDIMRQKKMGHFGKEDPQIKAEKARFKELKEDFRIAIEDHNSAPDSEKNTHREELVEMAEEIFEAKQNLRRMRVRKIQEELKSLEAEIAERDANREELIETFVNQKIGATLKGL